MSQISKALSEIVSQAHLMETALKANISQVERRGLDPVFIDRIAQIRDQIVDLNNEQEKLKAALKIKTEEVNEAKDALNELMKEARKVVKLSFPQAQWVEFGIAAKH